MLDTRTKGIHFVLCSTAFGILAWLVGVNADRTLDFGPSAKDSLVFKLVDDLRSFRVAESTSGFGRNKHGDLGSTRVQLKFEGMGGPLLKFASRRGFKGLTVYYLKKLYVELGCQAPKGGIPNSEIPLIVALCNKVAGEEANEAYIAKAVSHI